MDKIIEFEPGTCTELNVLLTDLGWKVLSAQNAQYILRAGYVYTLQGTIPVYL